jgi:outer membrane lipoprotein
MLRYRCFAVCVGLALLLLLGACSNVPRFDLGAVDRTVTPALATHDIDRVRGQAVHWGGVIIKTANLKDETHIELLAYTLDQSGRPDPNAAALGRFLLVKEGYLEPASYTAGRLVSCVGTLLDTRTSTVGEARPVIPVIHAEQIYLWPKSGGSSKPQVHFGVGVGIRR